MIVSSIRLVFNLIVLWTVLLPSYCLAAEEEAVIEIDAVTTKSQNLDEPCWNYTAAERARVREKLFNKIFGDSYNPVVKPESKRSVVTVAVEVAVISVSELNNLDGTFVLDSWFRLHWKDVRLIWNPDDYCGISRFPVPQDLLWVPDIHLWVLGSKPTKTTWETAMASVGHDGEVFLSNGRKDVIPCKLNLETFPQDTQQCTFSAGSWAHTSGDIQTVPYGDTTVPDGYSKATDSPKVGTGIDVAFFVQQATHTVDKILVETKLVQYAQKADPWVQVDYTFFIRRESYTYISTLIWPMLIVTFLATLNSMFHPLAPGKSIVAVTLLLTLSAIQITASNYVPKISYSTALSELYSVCLGYVLVSVMEAGISVYLATVARDAKNGSLQWHHPFITRIMDFLFWYIGVGGTVWKRRLEKWRKRRGRTTNVEGKGSRPYLNVNWQKESVRTIDDDAEIEKNTESARRKTKRVGHSASTENNNTRKTKDDDGSTLELVVGTFTMSKSNDSSDCETTSDRPNSDGSGSTARIKLSAHGNENDRQKTHNRKETSIRRYANKMPTYASAMVENDSGDHFLVATWEKLIELYNGETEWHDISNSDLVQAQKFFYTQAALYLDKVSSIVLPITFIIYTIVVLEQHGIRLFNHDARYNLDESFPSLEFIPAVWPE